MHFHIRFVCLLITVSFVFDAMPQVSGQTFNERMSDWPLDLKINGTVAICSDSEPSDEQVDYFRMANGDDAKVVTIQFGDNNDVETATDRWGKDITHYYAHLPAESMRKQTDSNFDVARLADALQGATGVWIQADSQLSREQKKLVLSLHDDLHELVKRGGVVLGIGSVGQSFGRHEIIGGQAFGDTRQATIRRGLNLIPDSVIQLDFERESAKPQLQGVLASHPKMIGMGLDLGAMLVLRGRKIRVLGEGNAHFFTTANDRQPIRTKSLSSSSSRRINPYESMIDLTAWRRDAIDRTLPLFPPANPIAPNVAKGTLMIIGGGGMPRGLMQDFIERAGGANARLIYVPCSERDEITTRDQRMVQSWLAAGVTSADVVHTKDRLQANSDEQFLEPLKRATGIFFGGGRQWNFADSYYGTETHRLMKEVLNRGGVIAGSSAGASIQAQYLARANPLGNVDIMAPGYERGGLGFITGVAIDQHFTQRRRQADMSSLVNRYPQILGIGIDERTAIVVNGSVAEVVGDGNVFMYNREGYPADAKPDYYKLSEGDRYNLATRKLVE